MWKLKIAEGSDPYLFSTNNFVGRQTWEFDPNAGTPEDRQEIENARQYFLNRKKEGFRSSSDLLMRIQVAMQSHTLHPFGPDLLKKYIQLSADACKVNWFTKDYT
ncbi:hypothetical protein LXL04_027542 [Taraxacum kok-saghyz]